MAPVLKNFQSLRQIMSGNSWEQYLWPPAPRGTGWMEEVLGSAESQYVFQEKQLTSIFMEKWVWVRKFYRSNVLCTCACERVCARARKQKVVWPQSLPWPWLVLSFSDLGSPGFSPQVQGPAWDSLTSLDLSQPFQSTPDKTMLWWPSPSGCHDGDVT